MASSSTARAQQAGAIELSVAGEGDSVSIRLWFAFYAGFLAATCVPLAVLIARQPWSASQWLRDYQTLLAGMPAAAKLLAFAAYLSVCCTFCPLPTGGIVAAVATREAAVAGGASDNVIVVAALTTVLVAAVGAVGSTIANLNDYHLFTLILRSRRVARVRNTRTVRLAVRWFARAPFFLLVLFNVIPIPVDVVRMLSSAHRYPRRAFAAANFIGRFVRYAVIAFVTYWWDLGWMAVVALLALAVVLAAGRTAKSLWGRWAHRPQEQTT